MMNLKSKCYLVYFVVQLPHNWDDILFVLSQTIPNQPTYLGNFLNLLFFSHYFLSPAIPFQPWISHTSWLVN
jgi:hypothetical protein